VADLIRFILLTQTETTWEAMHKIFSPSSYPGLYCLLNYPSKLVISRNLRTWTWTNETRLFSEVQTQRIVLDIIHSLMYESNKKNQFIHHASSYSLRCSN